MKIALNLLHFQPTHGGAEGYAIGLARGLVQARHEVHVFSETCITREFPVVHHPIRTALVPRSLREPAFAIKSRSSIPEGCFDVVMSFGKTLGADVVRASGGAHPVWLAQDMLSFEGGAVRLLKGLARRMSLRHSISHMLESKVYSHCLVRRVIALSEASRRDLIREYRIRPDRIVVIRNGVNLRRFHPGRRERVGRSIRDRHGLGREVIILFVANNFRLKGLAVLISAVARMSPTERRNLKCLIVGRDRALPFQRLARRLGVLDRVVFAGVTDRPEDYYAAADLLAHPTFYDTFGNVCLEAMASGLPVVTTAFCGASEIVSSGREGMVICDPRNTGDLAGAIARYLDSAERQRAGEAARALAEQYSEERNCREVLALFESVVQEKRERGAKPA